MDSLGRTVDFKNTVVIMTSNLGSGFLKRGSALDFGGRGDEADYEGLKSRMMDEAKRVFRPELLNRVDDVIVFRPLSRPDLVRILDLELEKIRSRLTAKKLKLHLTPPALDFLIEKGYAPEYGARPMRRAVERFVEDPLAERILSGDLGSSEPIEVVVDGDSLRFEQPAQPAQAGTAASG